MLRLYSTSAGLIVERDGAFFPVPQALTLDALFSAADPEDAYFQATHNTKIRFVGTGRDRQMIRTVTDLSAPPIDLRSQFAQGL